MVAEQSNASAQHNKCIDVRAFLQKGQCNYDRAGFGVKNIVRTAKITVLVMAAALLASTGAANVNNVAVCLDAADKKHWSKAVPACTKAAENGDKIAQTMLGFIYNDGLGVVQDYAQAVRWYRLAAEQGEATAQNKLGVMYSIGQGIAQDDKEAVRWYTLAALQDDAGAQTNLGIMYTNGRGVPQDYAQAVRWHRFAAAQGLAEAQNNLGSMYGNGQGVAQDFVLAHMWFNLAAVSGHGVARNNRDAVASKMTREQIAKAQQMATDCKAKNYKAC